VRLPPTPCRVCFRPCVFNKFSHFWQKFFFLAEPHFSYTTNGLSSRARARRKPRRSCSESSVSS
jgi:hypothetical protein